MGLMMSIPEEDSPNKLKRLKDSVVTVENGFRNPIVRERSNSSSQLDIEEFNLPE